MLYRLMAKSKMTFGNGKDKPFIESPEICVEENKDKEILENRSYYLELMIGTRYSLWIETINKTEMFIVTRGNV